MNIIKHLFNFKVKCTNCFFLTTLTAYLHPRSRKDPIAMNKQELEALIQRRFEEMPPKIQSAARYALDSPKEIALQSMRAVASQAGLQPASMLRLARDLGFANYESFRAIYIDWLSNQEAGLASRAEQWRDSARASGKPRDLEALLNAELSNIAATLGESNDKAFKQAERALSAAHHVYIVGLRSMYPPAFLLHYVLSTLRDGVTLLSGVGGTFADELRRIQTRDVFVVFSAFPYADMTLQALAYARQRGATIIAVTDSTVSPVALAANITILAPNSGQLMFPSSVPAVEVAQALGHLMIAQGGKSTLAEISNSEEQLKHFHVYRARK